MRYSMPFPIYIKKLRFREVNPEITQLVEKQHWRKTWKAFQEIITSFDFLLNILKFSAAEQRHQEKKKKKIYAAKASLQVGHW